MKTICFFVFLFFSVSSFSENVHSVSSVSQHEGISSTQLSIEVRNRPNHLIKLFKKRIRHTKRAMAAALAFPLPFGVLALHRIYLGTNAHVPVVYISTVGGVFGILPFIDCCLMIIDWDIDRFQNNGRVFMWIDQSAEK